MYNWLIAIQQKQMLKTSHLEYKQNPHNLIWMMLLASCLPTYFTMAPHAHTTLIWIPYKLYCLNVDIWMIFLQFLRTIIWSVLFCQKIIIAITNSKIQHSKQKQQINDMKHKAVITLSSFPNRCISRKHYIVTTSFGCLTQLLGRDTAVCASNSVR